MIILVTFSFNFNAGSSTVLKTLPGLAPLANAVTLPDACSAYLLDNNSHTCIACSLLRGYSFQINLVYLKTCPLLSFLKSSIHFVLVFFLDKGYIPVPFYPFVLYTLPYIIIPILFNQFFYPSP